MVPNLIETQKVTGGPRQVMRRLREEKNFGRCMGMQKSFQRNLSEILKDGVARQNERRIGKQLEGVDDAASRLWNRSSDMLKYFQN